MAIAIELYRKKDQEEIKAELDYAKEMNRERAELCQKSGLKAQAKLSERSWLDLEEMYHRLPFYESQIWDQFLPTIYSKNVGQWQNYFYDAIPKNVLDEIWFADALRIFDDFEIWTPASRFKDPVAVGVVHDEIAGERLKTHYLIARWGESLKPFTEIEEEVLDGNIQRHSETATPPKVKDYIRGTQKRNPRSLIHYYGKTRNPFHFHCWSGMYIVEYFDCRAFVCCYCGYSEKERRY